MSNILNPSYGLESPDTGDQSNDFHVLFRDIGIPLITLAGTLGGGVISARYIVGKWQSRKEISDIRKGILINYTNSFKNYVTLLDTFVAKLVMEFAEFTSNKSSNKTRLSELLPWGYTFNDIEFYSNKVPANGKFTNYKNEKYDKAAIMKKFKDLQSVSTKDTFLKFDIQKLEEFKDKNEISFKNEFYNTRSKVFEFKANLTQYYGETGSSDLSDEFSAMWEYMMGCYMLVNRILFAADALGFIELIRQYNSLAEFAFDMMINFERKLINEKIEI